LDLGKWKLLSMPKLPVFKGKELIKFLEYLDFQVTRTKGSHSRLISEDGRATSVPVHANKDIPKGLLRKIIREDLEMDLEDFSEQYSKYRGR
jgi:predicted RNA binding protein YcfA (HicA-like mRNA interferase family)